MHEDPDDPQHKSGCLFAQAGWEGASLSVSSDINVKNNLNELGNGSFGKLPASQT